MRLIDADALKALFDKRYDSAFMQMHTRANKRYWDGVCTGINWGRNTIADAFTINPDDIRPRGRWRGWHGETMVAEDTWKSYRYFQCSECDRKTAVQTNYCPNCGAKMDGKENEDG